MLVLKEPKTQSSVRKVFLPKTVAEMLIRHKSDQDEVKEIMGNEYNDFNMIFAGINGRPIEGSQINRLMTDLIRKNNLPPVVFHSIRHTSVTYKLKLNGGDVKSVQGDSGHSQSSMVTDVYSHILDEGRRNNARLFEDAFYKGKGADPGVKSTDADIDAADGVDAELISKLLSNPETVQLLKALTKKL